MSVFQEIDALDWPEEFIVEYRDGQQELLLRGDGVLVMSPSDDPDGIGGFDGYLPKKHPQNRQQYLRFVHFSDLSAIYDSAGTRLWPSP